MTIQCGSFESFMDAIAQLVERGLTFKAETTNLTITLTGGF